MSVNVTQYEVHLEAARVAAAASSWATVLVQVGAARACLAALPSGGDGGAQFAYDPAPLDALERQATAALSATSGVGRTGGPIQRSKITYKRISG